MHYIIENATLLSNGKGKKASILIENDQIRLIREKIPQMNVMKMDAGSFFMTPSRVIFTPHIPKWPFQQLKQLFIDQFLFTGCSTVITAFTLNYECEFYEKLTAKRMELLNCPIDYLLGVQIPANKITISFITKCKSEKIPIIFMELTSIKDLRFIPWGWIREAAFPFNPIFVPVIPEKVHSLTKKIHLQKWAKLFEEEKINHIPLPLPENKPLHVEVLKKFGLYPNKGILRAGGEISYNLYLKHNQEDEQRDFFDINVRPDIAVFKGKFLAVANQAFFRPGYGEELMLNKTALFV